jgi:hypothetical protein
MNAGLATIEGCSSVVRICLKGWICRRYATRPRSIKPRVRRANIRGRWRPGSDGAGQILECASAR